MKLNLSTKQRDIVNHTDGAILVKAGPGSGKTRVLIERIKHLLITKKRNKILALTFSNLAAEEMKSRLQEDSIIEDYIDNVTVGTIHSFCLDLVQTRGNLIGLGSEMVLFENNTDRQTLLRDVFTNDPQLIDLLKKQNNPESFLQKCLSLISEQKKKFISPEMCEFEEPFPKVYKEYNQELLEQNALDFDDILFYAYRILAENPGVVRLYTSLYKYICVDEAQDLNYAQYEVLKALCGVEFNNIMLVGDENQSIYGFNGSDSTLMSQRFVEDFNPTIYLLNENYRSSKTIVAYANHLENCESKSNYVFEGELAAFSFEDENAEAEYIIARIQELLRDGHADIEDKLSYDDFAIIARNRYVFSKVEEGLTAQKIPYFYKKTTSGIDNESIYMKAFELSTRLLINPRDSVHLKELCKISGSSASGSYQFEEGRVLLQTVLQDTNYVNILSSIHLVNTDAFDFGMALKKLESDLPSCISDDEKYLILNDIDQWRRHWIKYSSQVPRENRSLLSLRNYISLGKTQDITSDKGIALLTVHMSKGLQYEVVFVIGLTEGTFPDYRAVKNGGVEMEQEKNNMYVAVTRAKRLCYLTYPKFKMMPWGDVKKQYSSRFLNGVISQ